MADDTTATPNPPDTPIGAAAGLPEPLSLGQPKNPQYPQAAVPTGMEGQPGKIGDVVNKDGVAYKFDGYRWVPSGTAAAPITDTEPQSDNYPGASSIIHAVTKPGTLLGDAGTEKTPAERKARNRPGLPALPEKPLVDIGTAVGAKSPVAKGLSQFATNLLAPANIPWLATGDVFEALPEAASQTLTATFGAQMAKGLYDESKPLREALARGDTDKAIEIGSEMAPQALFTGLLVHSATKGVGGHLLETARTGWESAKEELHGMANAKAPEGSLEAGFAKLGGKKVKSAKSIEPPSIQQNAAAGFIRPDGTFQDLEEGDHPADAKKMGTTVPKLLSQGWIRKAGQGSYEVKSLNPATIKALDHDILSDFGDYGSDAQYGQPITHIVIDTPKKDYIIPTEDFIEKYNGSVEKAGLKLEKLGGEKVKPAAKPEPIGTPNEKFFKEVGGKEADNIDSPAKVQLDERAGRVRIRDLETPPNLQGQGHASALMSAITTAADKHGVHLELTASPFGDEDARLPHDQLKSFYQRHGFVEEPGFDPSLGYMIREPNKSTTPVSFDSIGGKQVSPSAPEPTFTHKTFGVDDSTGRVSAISDSGKDIGHVTYNLPTPAKRTGDFKATVAMASVDTPGQGLGQKLYLRTAEEAKAKGARYLVSDTVHGVDPSAVRVWDALINKGYPVEKLGDTKYRMDLSKLSMGEPAAPKAPASEQAPAVLDKIAKTFGTSTNAAKTNEGASFIQPDGKFIHLGAGEDHPAVIARHGYTPDTDDNRVGFINESGAVRTNFRMGRAGKTLAVSVPKDGVTPEQVDAIKQAVGQGLGRNGNLIIESADNPTNVRSQTKEFATPADVEPLLKKIGAHPEQSVSANAETAPSTEKSPNDDLQKSAQTKQSLPEGSKFVASSPEEYRAELDRSPRASQFLSDSAEELKNHQTFKMQTPDGKDAGIGYSITPGGEMRGVVNNGPYAGAATLAIKHAFEHGATQTETAWDVNGNLTKLYKPYIDKNGLHVVTVPYDEENFGPPPESMKAGWKKAGWKEGEPYPKFIRLERGGTTPAIAQKAADMAAKQGGGFTIHPTTGEAPKTGYQIEVPTEQGKTLDHPATAKDIQDYADEHKALLAAHPELHIGGYNNTLGLSVAADSLDAAKRVAKTLDQISVWDNTKGEEIFTGGKGERKEFSNYPLEDRMKDLRGENQSDIPGFEHLSKDVHDHLEPDERDYLKDDKTLQRNVMSQYHKIQPSVAETTNAMQAGAALGGWWKRYIDVFHNLAGSDAEQVANTVGPSHAEVLKQWHAALSGNKLVEDANNLAWHTYADWLDAGKPTDRKSINDIVSKNGAQPESSGKKGNAALSDKVDRKGRITTPGMDTTKLFNLVNSPEMKGERPFSGDVFRDDAKNPLMGSSEGYRKIPSMGASVAGKGNLNRLVIDQHIHDFYGQAANASTAARYIADSAHLRQAAEALGRKGGEGQEQLWGTVLGLKTLLKEGLTPAEASGKLNADVINRIGKDYAEVIANDPEITRPGGVLDRLKEKHGIGRGSAGFSPENRETPSAGPTGKGGGAGSEAAVDKTQLEKTAGRIRGAISDTKIKKPTSAAKKTSAMDLINMLGNLKKPAR